MKKINLIAILAVVGAIFLAPATTNAACYYPNFEDEDGRCVSPADAARYNYSYTPAYNYSYQYSYGNYNDIWRYLQELYRLLAILEDLQAQLEDYESTDTRLEVSTLSATNVTDDSARLRGEVDFNGEDEAWVHFEWGESRYDLDHKTNERLREEDEDEESFYYTIYGLDEDETYYFRAIARDEDREYDYGSIRSFTTDDESDYDDDPDVETGDADDITDDSAKIYGEVDMNDFNNGVAFFVWGEDEDQVEDIEDDYDTYYDIDEDGEDLQKVRVDSDVDGSLDAWAHIYNLDDDTDIYYRFCVEYEDEDDDDVIRCGDTEDFTTDD